MGTEAKLLNELFRQQRALNGEQNRVSQELVEVNQKIQYLLTVHANRAVRVDPKKAPELPSGEARVHNGLAKNGARQSWFHRGEAVKLIRRAARRSMRPAQVVHAVMDAKGYATSLTREDKKRAEAAIYQAVISAVRAGALLRDDEGAVRVKA